MNSLRSITAILVSLRIVASGASDEQVEVDIRRRNAVKCHLWSKGGFDLDLPTDELVAASHRLRLGPVMEGRIGGCNAFQVRGGDATTSVRSLDEKLASLTRRFGPRFAAAIRRNEEDHAADCAKSCENFYCADKSWRGASWDETATTTIKSYSFGGLPPEDFAEEFGFPLDLIKVTENAPLFSAEESAEVLRVAIEEGVDQNEYESGKYKLGGDWLVNLPQTRAWFNVKLQETFFPLLHHLFPEIVSSPSVLRAHSVSLLKYNNTHPRTDVHIDNGILAMTLAMTPSTEYVGGGTFYEHFGSDNVLPMDVGHGTFRPGSVRHGGHRVQDGVRFILGAFLLIEDRVEHVRRLKNQGAELRKAGDVEGAAEHFEWALALNPKCATCLKDWGEILLSQKDFVGAEAKIRQVLELLDNRDSDALFMLGVILSEQGRDEESIESYKQSLALNAEDAELCFNLGVKLAARGDSKGEMRMYFMATQANPKYGRAWMNLGIALAEAGDFDDSEAMFLKALECETEIRPQTLSNIALLYKERAQAAMKAKDFTNVKLYTQQAGNYLDDAKPLFDALVPFHQNNADLLHYANGFEQLRKLIFRLNGGALIQLQEFELFEKEMRRMADLLPNAWESWYMLSMALRYSGKAEEATSLGDKAMEMRQKMGL